MLPPRKAGPWPLCGVGFQRPRLCVQKLVFRFAIGSRATSLPGVSLGRLALQLINRAKGALDAGTFLGRERALENLAIYFRGLFEPYPIRPDRALRVAANNNLLGVDTTFDQIATDRDLRSR